MVIRSVKVSSVSVDNIFLDVFWIAREPERALERAPQRATERARERHSMCVTVCVCVGAGLHKSL